MRVLRVNGVDYQHGTLGYLEEAKLLCEMYNMTEEQATEIFKGEPKIEFINSDGFTEDFTGMKLIGFLDEELSPGSTGVLLKR